MLIRSPLNYPFSSCRCQTLIYHLSGASKLSKWHHVGHGDHLPIHVPGNAAAVERRRCADGEASLSAASTSAYVLSALAMGQSVNTVVEKERWLSSLTAATACQAMGPCDAEQLMWLHTSACLHSLLPGCLLSSCNQVNPLASEVRTPVHRLPAPGGAPSSLRLHLVRALPRGSAALIRAREAAQQCCGWKE